MATDVTKTLRKALAELEGEREKIERQIGMIRQVLAAGDTRGMRRVGGRTTARRKGTRKPMSAAARKAVSRRMKAYWKKRRMEAAKGKGEVAK